MSAVELNWLFNRVPAPRIRLHQMKLHEGVRLVDAEEDPAKAGDDLVKGSQLPIKFFEGTKEPETLMIYFHGT